MSNFAGIESPPKNGFRLAATRGLRQYSAFLAYAAASVLIVLREPGHFLRPQFFADDGLFFQTAFNQGWRVLLPYTGYFQAIPSLAAWVSSQLPMDWAPFLFTFLALLLHALPVGFLFSSRCAHLNNARWPLAAAYIALPETDWLNANLCHAFWHLALLGFLIVTVAKGQWKWFDRAVLIGLGMSSVFGLLLLPVARRYQALLALTAVVQIAAVLATPRRAVDLNAGLTPLAAIVSNHIVIGSLIGFNPWTWGPGASWIVALCGAAIAGYAVWRGPSSLRRLWVFACLALAAALARPPVDWPHLALPGWGQRYWLIPGLAFVVSLGWMARRGNEAIRTVGWTILFPMIAATPLTWRYPARVVHDFPGQVARFQRTAKGTATEFSYNPAGWTMRLVRK